MNGQNPVEYDLLEPLTGLTDEEGLTSVPVSPEGISDYFNQTYNFLLILIAITAVFYLIYGGMVYLTTDIANKQKQGKEIIIRVITGLIFVFTVWIILNSINPAILNNKLTFAVLDSNVNNPGTGPSNPPNNPPNNPPPNTTGEQCTAIPESDLVVVQPSRKLKTAAADKFNQMYMAAQKDGINLKLTSAYRSPADQLRIWNENGCKLVNSKAVCFGGKSVAVPCQLGGNGSNHSTGYAVDINVGCINGQSNCNTKTYQWLKANGSKYNFYNNLPSDPVHWSANGR